MSCRHVCLSRHFFTHLPALSSHFISFAFVQSAFVFGASLVCANAGAAKATLRVKAIADNKIFISLLRWMAPGGRRVLTPCWRQNMAMNREDGSVLSRLGSAGSADTEIYQRFFSAGQGAFPYRARSGAAVASVVFLPPDTQEEHRALAAIAAGERMHIFKVGPRLLHQLAQQPARKPAYE